MTDTRLRELNQKHEAFLRAVYDDLYKIKKGWRAPKLDETGEPIEQRRSKIKELVNDTLERIDAHLREC